MVVVVVVGGGGVGGWEGVIVGVGYVVKGKVRDLSL